MRSITPSRCGADPGAPGDSHQHNPPRFQKDGARPAPFSIEPRRHQQECKESNPAGRVWRPLASQKHTPVFKRASDGIRTRTSCFTGRRAYQVHHRHHIYCQRKERESNPQGRKAQPASNRVPSPVGLPFRITQ